MKNFNKHVAMWGLVAISVAVVGYRKRKTLNAIKQSNDAQEIDA